MAVIYERSRTLFKHYNNLSPIFLLMSWWMTVFSVREKKKKNSLGRSNVANRNTQRRVVIRSAPLLVLLLLFLTPAPLSLSFFPLLLRAAFHLGFISGYHLNSKGSWTSLMRLCLCERVLCPGQRWTGFETHTTPTEIDFVSLLHPSVKNPLLTVPLQHYSCQVDDV